MNHAPISKGRKSVSVGSVCVLDDPWLELLADRFLLLLLMPKLFVNETKLFWGAFVLFPKKDNFILYRRNQPEFF